MTIETKVEHTPEPWAVDESYGAIVAEHPSMGMVRILEAPDFHDCDPAERAEAIADLKRAAAAVSACKGIPTEALEGRSCNVITQVRTELKHAHQIIGVMLNMMTAEQRAELSKIDNGEGAVRYHVRKEALAKLEGRA